MIHERRSNVLLPKFMFYMYSRNGKLYVCTLENRAHLIILHVLYDRQRNFFAKRWFNRIQVNSLFIRTKQNSQTPLPESWIVSNFKEYFWRSQAILIFFPTTSNLTDNTHVFSFETLIFFTRTIHISNKTFYSAYTLWLFPNICLQIVYVDYL